MTNIKQKYFDQVAYRPFINLAQRTVDMSTLQCGKQTFSLIFHRNIFYFCSKKYPWHFLFSIEFKQVRLTCMNVFILQEIVYGNSFSPYWIHFWGPGSKMRTWNLASFLIGKVVLSSLLLDQCLPLSHLDVNALRYRNCLLALPISWWHTVTGALLGMKLMNTQKTQVAVHPCIHHNLKRYQVNFYYNFSC